MALYQPVEVKLWSKDWFVGSGPATKLVFVYLLTNPLRNPAGLYEIPITEICHKTKLRRDTVAGALRVLEEKEKAYYDMSTTTVLLLNAAERALLQNNPKVIDGIRRDFDECKSIPLKILFWEKYHKAEGLQTLTRPPGETPIKIRLDSTTGLGKATSGGERRKHTQYDAATKKLIVPPEMLEDLYADFGREVVDGEIPKMEKWLKWNKPKKDYNRFIVNWLNRPRREEKRVTRGRPTRAGGATTIDDVKRRIELDEERRRQQEARRDPGNRGPG